MHIAFFLPWPVVLDRFSLHLICYFIVQKRCLVLKMAELQASITQLTTMVKTLSEKTALLEERLAHVAPAGAPAVIGGLSVKKEDLLKPSRWKACYFLTAIQRKVFIEDLREHFGRRMTEGAERSRDSYELENLLDGLELDLQFFAEETRGADVEPTGVFLKKLKLFVKRALLLKEKTENGVESMKALERRLEDQGYEAEFETALKEVRARQQQAALQRTGSRVETESTLPRTSQRK